MLFPHGGPHDFLEPLPLPEEGVVGSGDSPNMFKRGEKRSWILLIIFCMAGLGLVARLLFLSIQRGQLFLGRSEQNRLRENVLPAPRGEIFDRYGKRLATSIATVVLGIRPMELPNATGERVKLLEKLSELYQGDEQEYFKEHWPQYLKNRGLVTVPIPLSQKAAVKLGLLESDNLGITTVPLFGRLYPLGQEAAHLTGYVGISDSDSRPIIVGRTGLEQSYQEILRGQDGKRIVEVDTYGEIHRIVSEITPRPGNSLITSLDADLQGYVRGALSEGIRTAGARRGAAIVFQPITGEVLAMVSYPDFDPNALLPGQADRVKVQKLLNNQDRPFFIRAIAGLYPPGSILKPFWVAGALTQGIINEKTVIQDRGSITVKDQYSNKDYTFRGWKPDGLGAMTVKSALAWSSDIFFYVLLGGYENFSGLGITKAVEILRSLRVDQYLNIDLPGESNGLLPTPEWKKRTRSEKWFLGDTYNLSIGQGYLLVTPLQMAVWTSALINGGTIWQPKIVQRIINTVGQTTNEFSSKPLAQNLFSPEALAIVQTGLREAVTTGTARSLSGIRPTVAGKTGTAEWGSKGSTPHAWFVGYAPVTNPSLLVTVLIERGGEGSDSAVPVAGKIFDWYFNTHLPAIQNNL